LLLVGQLPERLIFGMALAMLLTRAANGSILTLTLTLTTLTLTLAT
jgi:hypothetical protein